MSDDGQALRRTGSVDSREREVTEEGEEASEVEEGEKGQEGEEEGKGGSGAPLAPRDICEVKMDDAVDVWVRWEGGGGGGGVCVGGGARGRGSLTHQPFTNPFRTPSP